MKKTQCTPGKTMAFKTREDEEELVVQWFNAQSIYSDSIRYLIQKEIAENGIRNLQLFIPSYRDVASVKDSLSSGSISSTPSPSLAAAYTQKEDESRFISHNNYEKETNDVSINLSKDPHNQKEEFNVMEMNSSQINDAQENSDTSKPVKANKTFDAATLDSYRM